MESPKKQAAKILRNRKTQRRWLAVIVCLALLVTTGTVTALKLNGQAMNRDASPLTCSFVPHAHTDACYDADGNLVCGQADFVVHTHNADCLTNGELTCTLPEIAPHTHTEDCYATEKVLTCTLAESEDIPAHTHTDACYTVERPLTCTVAEHTHIDACYTVTEGEKTLTCGQEETDGAEGHTHTDACYTVTPGEPVLTCTEDHEHTDACYAPGEDVRTLTCGQEETPAVPAHHHTEDCYTAETVSTLTCDKPEHTHTDACYGEPAGDPVLTCTLPESETGIPGHHHTDACYTEEKVLTCTQPALHTHDGSCYDENGKLVCGMLQLTEHVHSPACFTSDVQLAAATRQLVYEDANLRLTADYSTDSYLYDTTALCLVAAGTPVPTTPNPAPDAEVALSVEDPAAADASADEPAADEALPGDAQESLVRPAMMAGAEQLPAAPVTYTLQYLGSQGQNIGEPVTYEWNPGDAYPAFAPSAPTFTQTFTGDDFVVTATYTAEAALPENAELRASHVTDEAVVADYLDRYRQTLGSEHADVRLLLDIGFWADDAEVQPAAPVNITIQLLDADGMPDGEQLMIVHFPADADAQVLPAQVDADSASASFDVDSFSIFVIGSGEASEDGSVTLNPDVATFTWTTDYFTATFTLDGTARPVAAEDADAERADADADAADTAEAADATDADTTGTDTGTDNTGAPAEKPAPLATPGRLQWEVELLDKTADADVYAQYTDYAGKTPADLLDLQVIRYSLTYNDMPMDLSDVNVSVQVTPTQAFASFSDSQIPTSTLDMETGAASIAPEAMEDAAGAVLKVATPRTLAADAMLPDAEAAVEELAADENTDPADLEQLTALVDELRATADYAIQLQGSEPLPADADADTAVIAPAVADDLLAAAAYAADTAPQAAGELGFIITGQLNPSFTVQYYAEVEQVERGEAIGRYDVMCYGNDGNPTMTTNNIYIYELAGRSKGLPNGTNNSGEKIFAQLTVDTGRVMYDEEPSYEIKKVTNYVQMYKDCKTTYFERPDLRYFNAMEGNEGFEITSIIIGPDNVVYTAGTLSNSGKTPIPVSQGGDGKLYYNNKELVFSNKDGGITVPDLIDDKYYLRLADNEVIRLNYKQRATITVPESARFYDYNISSSYDSNTCIMTTGTETDGAGINAYGDAAATGTHIAFGVTASPFSDDVWNGQTLNRVNDNNFGQCTFGLVTGVTKDGQPQFADGIQAPENLFGNTDDQGSTPYPDAKLGFKRTGDTYTLSTATADGQHMVSGLEKLHIFYAANAGQRWTNKSSYTGDGYDADYREMNNGFWPLDFTKKDGDNSANNYVDPRGSGEERMVSYKRGNEVNTIPTSANLCAHNAYFGMSYAVNFTLDKDYVGPLDYYFFGDDDLWVILQQLDAQGNPKDNGTVVCDLGGVHTTIGAHTDIWDHIEGGKDGRTETQYYRLYVFYTERGDFASTCWMRYTLPHASSVQLDTKPEQTGTLTVTKQVEKQPVDGSVEQAATTVDNDQNHYVFRLTLDNGQNASGIVTGKKVLRDGSTTNVEPFQFGQNNNCFSLRAGDTLEIYNLPQGVRYTLEEIGVVTAEQFKLLNDTDKWKNNEFTQLNTNDYTAIASSGYTMYVGDKPCKDYQTNGTIIGGKTTAVTVVNRNDFYTLPKTGGEGVTVYYVGGAVVLLTVGYLYTKRRRARR